MHKPNHNKEFLFEKYTVKILFNARALIINNAFSIEGDGRLLEATLFGNVQAFIDRI